VPGKKTSFITFFFFRFGTYLVFLQVIVYFLGNNLPKHSIPIPSQPKLKEYARKHYC